MLRNLYFKQLHRLLERVETELEEPVSQASAVIARVMSQGNCIHLYDTGHLLDSEMVNRAGGFVAFQRFRLHYEVENGVRKRPGLAEKDRDLEGLMAYALKTSNMLPGDVLIVGSVSGKSSLPVDLALAAKKMGVYVIGLTSVEYSRKLASQHPSGLRLFEAVDLVIDNLAPPLDAMVEVEGMEAAICPASGISAAVIMWAITAQVTDNLLALGLQPSVLKSINFPGSDVFNDKMYERYAETSL